MADQSKSQRTQDPPAKDKKAETHPRGEEDHGSLVNVFGRFSARAANATGSPIAFAVAILVLVIWALSGPVFGFSNTWQLIINTGTTIVTFIMVFVIQSAQNRDTRALQVKLDSILKALHREAMIDIEDLDDTELERLQERMRKRYGEVKPKGADA